MDSIITILGALLALLFFLNIKPASEVFCRILCGFSVLIALNSVLMIFSPVAVGVNLITAIIIGVFGAPGGFLVYAVTLLL